MEERNKKTEDRKKDKGHRSMKELNKKIGRKGEDRKVLISYELNRQILRIIERKDREEGPE